MSEENRILLIVTIVSLHFWICTFNYFIFAVTRYKKVQVGKDQEKAQSEKDSHSKNRGGKKTN